MFMQRINVWVLAGRFEALSNHVEALCNSHLGIVFDLPVATATVLRLLSISSWLSAPADSFPASRPFPPQRIRANKANVEP